MPNALARRADARRHARTPADPSQAIDESWIDNVVHELVDALKRQLSRFKNIERRAGAAKSPAAMARALVAMEQMLERLLQLEKEREQARKMRTENVVDARARLEARLDERLAFVEEQIRREEEEENRRCEEMIEAMAVMGTA
jgi:hypothetical protein